MARRRRDEGGSGLARVFGLIEDAPAGLHDVDPPAERLPVGLPEGLIELYARCDGARLFLDTIELVPSAEVDMAAPARWRFASVDDDVLDGTRLERWLAGIVDATSLLYDRDGEFAEDAFGEDGEIVPQLR